MSIITRGFGENQRILTRGYGPSGIPEFDSAGEARKPKKFKETGLIVRQEFLPIVAPIMLEKYRDYALKVGIYKELTDVYKANIPISKEILKTISLHAKIDKNRLIKHLIAI